MQNWNFSPKQALSLPLAADARLVPTDYTDDQIWEFKLGSTEPPAISVETTFGLRARLCRIFPRFIYDGNIVNDPAQFSQPIILHRYFPNYLEISCKPFSCINVKLEYWVPDSHLIAGRITLTNTTKEKCNMQLELAEHLIPSADGARMIINEIGMTTLLMGKTSNIFPVLFLTGGAQSGKSPYPSLNLSLSVPPHDNQEVYWAHASCDEATKSYALAKEVINKKWDAEFARITRENAQILEIQTGNQDWDTAFRLSQVLAHQLFVKPTKQSISSSIVSTRKPDQGYSLLGDGSDYNYLWNGQTPFDIHYLTNFLLPGKPQLVKDLLDNFLDIQAPQGEIDLKPGIAGQRSRLLATPLIAETALQLFDYDEDVDYIKSIYPKLVSFFQSWFTGSHDRDGDFFPEWDHVLQTGIENPPFFSQNLTWMSGVDITTIEHPSLCSFLYRECISLIDIGKKINDSDNVRLLESIAERLKEAVEQTWNDQSACYLSRDRESHHCSEGITLGTRSGEGLIEIHKDFQIPVRPGFFIESQHEITHPTKIFIHGSGETGVHRVEHIPPNRIRWQHQYGFSTSTYIYNSIEHIEINGVRPDDHLTVKTASLTFMDQTLLLPLWAGIPSKERAKILINLTIMNKKKFLAPYGLRTWNEFPGMGKIAEEFYGINLPWITFILDGLILYGERKKAAEVFHRLMEAVVRAINKDMTLHQAYHSESGKALSVQNSLTSLIPIGLFLRIIGVKIVNPFCVEISGKNPFPWPVTIKFQGLSIVRQEKKTVVIFPDGKNLTLDNNQKRRITSNRKNQDVYENDLSSS